jgi:DNA (cytosine-5)-methyltransferase 1
MPTKTCVDMFCGAGGTSEGILRAARRKNLKVRLTAINHWPLAIGSHSLNHPGVVHICEDLDRIRPHEVVPRGVCHILAASPECTHHSNARGGKPRDEQSRATAWHVTNWCSRIPVENVLLENVPEFQSWGPLGANGKPLKSKKGTLFNAFVHTLRSIFEHVEWRELCCADYGDPTSRVRLYLQARHVPITWPEPTHGPGRPFPHRTARECIDFSLKGKSIFHRQRPLSPNTLRRIAAGLRKFGGPRATEFLVMLYGTGDARSLDRPMPTVTADGNHIALVEPVWEDEPTAFVLGQQSGGAPRSVDAPLPTVCAGGALSLVEFGFLVGVTHGQRDNSHSLDRPMPTLTTAKGGEYALVEAVAREDVRTGRDGSPSRPSDDECPSAFYTKYYRTATARSLDQPLDTVTTKDRFLLVEPVRERTPSGRIRRDIRLRMLEDYELQQAQGFPRQYRFEGSKKDRIKQIGNANPCHTADALASLML